jgi:hypothetical protein
VKKIIVIVLSVLTIAFATSKNFTQIQTTTEQNATHAIPPSSTIIAEPNTNTDNLPLLGRTEVIGGTAYDWINGPVMTWMVNDPAYGIHVSWLWSNTEALSDRNMRYNFYDWSTHSWNWLDATNYMNSGLAVFPHVMTSVAGGSDVDPITGNVVVSGNYSTGGTIAPELARDLAPGAGLFEYSQGPLAYRWPVISVGHNQAVHCAVIDATSTDSLFYTRCSPWGTWSTPIRIPYPAPDPYFPNQNISASKISNKVIIVWEESEPVGAQDRAYYRLSNDGGTNWDPPVQIPYPPVQGFFPTYNISSFFAMFDAQDNFHIVTSVAETTHTIPVEVWHYCPTNSPQWGLIHHYDADTLTAPVGYNALFATRPSLIQNPSNNYLYVTWEVFDSLNYEPLTNQARAEIWAAESRDNGVTWRGRTRITTPNTMSKRFPVAGGIQVTPSTTDYDTLLVMYMADSIAGFFLQDEHRFCQNPIICHRVPVPLPDAIEEDNDTPVHYNFALSSPVPNPFYSRTSIRYSIPAKNNVSLVIYDASGRKVKTLVSETQLAGEHTISWDGTNDNGKKVNAGIYFYNLKTTDKSITQKIIISN